ADHAAHRSVGAAHSTGAGMLDPTHQEQRHPIGRGDAMLAHDLIHRSGKHPAVGAASRSSTSRGIRVRLSSRSRSKPNVQAQLGLESASIANTPFCPSRASKRASVPAIVVFPEPPFPATAIFMLL